jgi:hypothetical protein
LRTIIGNGEGAGMTQGGVCGDEEQEFEQPGSFHGCNCRTNARTSTNAREEVCIRSEDRRGEERRGEGEGEALGPCGSIFNKCGVGLVFGSRNQFLTEKDW